MKPNDLDRRRLLALAAAAAPALAAAPAARAAASEWKDAIIVDALGGLDDPNIPSSDGSGLGEAGPRRRRVLSKRVLDDARASGVTAINCTLGYVAGPAEPFEATVSDIALYDRMIADHPGHLLKVTRAADIVSAKQAGKVGLIYGFQNAAMVGDNLDRIDMFADLGVRVVQLTYNPANQIGDGSTAPQNRGLTPFGRQVVERLNANRLMVDLSHSGQATCLEAARASAQPISINHTGCRALVDLPRNKTDEELRLVADKGGFVGIYFMPFLHKDGYVTGDDVVAHIEHAVQVCGEDHVGLGTDGVITKVDDLDAYRAAVAKEVAARKAAGIGAPGEKADILKFAIDLRGPTQFHDLADRLKARGHSTARVEKILGRNFLRYAADVWGG
ncbi:MAG: dipeptidase [Phenylobacterium sp.]|uniref:dipeptidase n=1 Tax=Phenylobacterium sp. TaxID=1871053 RepID=UPI00391C3CC8